jgi:uncharacterized protein YkwD
MRLTVATIFVFLLFQCACNTIIYKTSGGSIRDYSISKRILKHINEARAKGTMCGNQYYEAAKPVVWNKKLAEASLQHSIDMAENGFLSHIGSNSGDLSVRLFNVNYEWSSCAENIGHGYQNSEEAVQSWLKSKMHCKNIMNPEFKEIGAAYAKSASYRTYWTLVFGSPNH